MHLSSTEYADDAVLADENAHSATARLTNLDANAQQEAGMKISISQNESAEYQTTPKSIEHEDDITNLPPEKKFKHECDKCKMTYPTKHGLAVHQG